MSKQKAKRIKGWPNPPKPTSGYRYLMDARVSTYKPYDTEVYHFDAMSYGKHLGLRFDSGGIDFEATLTLKDIDRLIALLIDARRLMKWQQARDRKRKINSKRKH